MPDECAPLSDIAGSSEISQAHRDQPVVSISSEQPPNVTGGAQTSVKDDDVSLPGHSGSADSGPFHSPEVSETPAKPSSIRSSRRKQPITPRKRKLKERMTSTALHTPAMLMTSAGPFDELDQSSVTNRIICEVYRLMNGTGRGPQGKISWQQLADLMSTKYSHIFSVYEVRRSVTSVKDGRAALKKNTRPGDDIKLQSYLNETYIPQSVPKKGTRKQGKKSPEQISRERKSTRERKPTSRSREHLQESSLVYHHDPFMKAFEIQSSEGLVKRYKLTSTRAERDARCQTLGETLAASGDDSSKETLLVERGKMVRLQRQLLEIRKKQGEYLERLSEERQKVASLEARIRELETTGKSGGGEGGGGGGGREGVSSSQDITQPDGVTCTPLTKDQVIAGASRFLGEPLLSFFVHQIKGTDADGGPPLWNKEMRKLPLELYGRSPSAYSFLEEFFALPPVDSINAWLNGEDSLEESASTRIGDTVEGLEGTAEDPAASLEKLDESNVALCNSEYTDAAMDSATAIDDDENVAKLSENLEKATDIASTNTIAEVLAGNSEADNTEMKSDTNGDLPGETSEHSKTTNEHNSAMKNTATGSSKALEGGTVRLCRTDDVGSNNTAIDGYHKEAGSSVDVRPKAPETVIVYLDCLHPLSAKKRKL